MAAVFLVTFSPAQFQWICACRAGAAKFFHFFNICVDYPSRGFMTPGFTGRTRCEGALLFPECAEKEGANA
jgi:hypothetical protein